MPESNSRCGHVVRRSMVPSALLGLVLLGIANAGVAQSVPPALESSPAGPPQTGSQGQKLIGMPKFHEPAPYNFETMAVSSRSSTARVLAGGTRTQRSGAWMTA